MKRFEALLPFVGVANPDVVPLIHDVGYVRDLLELAVRDDLLGPAAGPHELIKDMSVRDRYLVGKLAPPAARGAAEAVRPAAAPPSLAVGALISSGSDRVCRDRICPRRCSALGFR